MAKTKLTIEELRNETVEQMTARLEAERADEPKQSTRLVLNRHPDILDHQQRMGNLSSELQSLHRRQEELAPLVRSAGNTARAAAVAAWNATNKDGGTMEVEADPTAARAEYQKNAARIVVLEKAVQHADQVMNHYVDGELPLRLRVSMACWAAARPELLEAAQILYVHVQSMADSLIAIEAIARDLERGGTVLTDAAVPPYGPFGSPSGLSSVAKEWIKDLESYIKTSSV